ncbi:MAG TPA: WYL domain-containing protein [Trebonia sp.]|nr:WYL domain-containing protein [Trebonia sp.]
MAETELRLLRLLSLLTAGRTWRGDDLAERLAVTPRTVRRDVDRLRELGYQVHSVPGPAGGYQLGAGSALPPMLLDDDAAVAVAAGLRAVTDGAVAGMDEAAVRAAAAIERVLPDRLKRRVDALHAAVVPLPSGTPPVEPSVLALIALACQDSERLRFAYTDAAGRETRRHVEPYRLVSAARRWYLVAWDVERSSWRGFRLDRLADPLPTGVRSRPADPPDAARFIAEGMTTAPYKWQVRVLLDAPASVVAARVPPTVAVIEAAGDTQCVLTSGSESLDAIAMHLIMIDIPFTPLSPPELGARCADLARRLAAAAGRAASGG